MKNGFTWPKTSVYWREGDASFASIPFTWELKKVRRFIRSRPGKWTVGGPAIFLMPDYFQDLPDVSVKWSWGGILQRHNPYATRTTRGCPNKCKYCAIGSGKIERGAFIEKGEWPDRPILCDNNLLAASERHLQRVFDRLRWWGWADFNQGLDCRLVTPEIAKEIHSIGKPIVRVSLDSWSVAPVWEYAVNLFLDAGVAKRRMHSYVMIGWGDDPRRDIERVEYAKTILGPGSVNAMWFHELDAMKPNVVTEKQAACGWTDRLRIDTMRWSYGRGPKPDILRLTTGDSANADSTNAS